MLSWIQFQRALQTQVNALLTDRDLAPIMPLLRAERTSEGLRLDWSAITSLLVNDPTNNQNFSLVKFSAGNNGNNGFVSGEIGRFADYYFIEVGYRGEANNYKSTPNNIIKVTKNAQSTHTFSHAELEQLVANVSEQGAAGKQFVVKLIFGYREEGRYAGVYGPRIEMHLTYPAQEGVIESGYALGGSENDLAGNQIQLVNFLKGAPSFDGNGTPAASSGTTLDWREELAGGEDSPIGISTSFRGASDFVLDANGEPTALILDLRAMGYEAFQKRPFNGK